MQQICMVNRTAGHRINYRSLPHSALCGFFTHNQSRKDGLLSHSANIIYIHSSMALH